MSQAQALDILTRNAGEVARRAQARDLGGGVILALFRVVKLATLHAIDNQAMVRQVEETVAAVQAYGQRADQNVSVLFTQGSVFVGGQLLKASRAAYDAASELGEILKRCGAAELHVARDVRAADFYAFATVLAEALRSATPVHIERPSPRIRLRSVNEAALERGVTLERLDPNGAMVRTYASAVVIMRRFYEDLARAKYTLPQRVKRVAQRLVDLSAGETPAFLGVTAARNANQDEAGRAVNTAILSLAIARQITTDPVLLLRLAMSALLLDTGRPRLLGLHEGGRPGGIVPQLSDQQDDEVPAATAVVLTALGRVNEPSVMRTVIAYEAHWLKRQAHLGPVYGGLRQPTLQARIVASARLFNDLLTPAPGQQAMTADQAIAELEQTGADAADRTVLRLLVGALGIFPTGTLVELSTGEVALVVNTPADPARYPQPRVRLLVNADGSAIDRPLEIDLSQQPAGRPPRHIVRVVSTSDDSASAHLRALAATPSPAAASGVRQQPIADVPARGAPQPRAPDLGPARPTPAEPKLTPTHSYGSRTVPAYSAEPSVSIEEAPDIEIFEGDEAAMSARGIALIEEQERLLEEELEAEEDKDESTRAMPVSPDEIKATMRAQAPEPQTAPSDRPSPTATGDLTRTPLVHLLVYMLDTRLTGTAVFQTPDGISHGVFFTEGTPAKVQTGTIFDPLDRVILDLGLLDEATLAETLREVSRRRVLHGRHLVAKGLLDRETVLSVLRLQMVRKITHLFDLPAGTQYAYYEGVNLLAGYGGPELTPCEPLALIMAGVRLRGDDPLVDATLERISGRRLGLRRDGDTRRFELQRHETAAVDLLRSRPMTLGQLLNAGLGHERAVKLTMYALAITRHLDLGVVAKLPVGVVPGEFRQPEPAPSLPPSAPPRSPVPVAAPPRGAAVSAMPTPLVTVVPTFGSSPPTPTPSTAPSAPPSPASPARAGRQAPPASPTVGPSSAPVTAPARTVRTGFGIAFGQTAPRSPPPPVAPSVPPTASTPPAGRSMRPAPAKAAEALRASVGAVPTPASPVPSSDFRPSDPPRSMPPMSRPPGSRPPVSRPADSMAPSGPTTGRHSYTGEHAARKQEIDQRAASLDNEDYFSLLGVPRTATADEIQDAYFALAKIWHPDRQPLELVGHKVKVARVFARMTEACQTLIDAAKRHDYQRAIDQGGGTPEDQRKIARVVDAALEFQKAEILLRKHDLVGAEVLAARAVQADPDQPEYLTLLVWIQGQRRGEPPPLSEGRTSTHYDDLIKVLDGVLGKEPRYERALFYRGMLLKRAGRADKAIRDFRLAAEINPRNLDAMREVRLYEMRRRSGGGPSEHPRSGPPGSGGGGLFGKLFKK